jgi:hypothetical protein
VIGVLQHALMITGLAVAMQCPEKSVLVEHARR